jgi:hypothetical protein
MTRKTARILLILVLILVLLGSMLACKIDGGGDKTPTAGCYIDAGGNLVCPPASWDGGIQATVTYGAEQFHLQLTALAEPEE